MLRRYGIQLILLLSPFFLLAQDPAILSNKGQIQQELQELGINDTIFREALKKRGIDFDEIDRLQLEATEKIIEEVIQELKYKQQIDALLLENETFQSLFNRDSLTKEIIDSIFLLLNQQLIPQEDSSKLDQIYGHQIFDAAYKTTELDTLGNVIFRVPNKIPDSYVLGIGDELTISIFGQSQFDAKFEINQEGFIKPKQIPKIHLAGTTLGQAKELLRKRFSSYYVFRASQFSVSLVRPRIITVNVFGAVKNPGAFNLPASSTVFNALVEAGGITEKGSVRNIRLINDTDQKTFDIYDFLNNPTRQADFYLEDNAIVQVPSARKVVYLKGAISNPMGYELENQEGIIEAIDFAGGATADAYLENVQIKRFGDIEQQLIDINLSQILAQKQRLPLENGDTILIRTIPAQLKSIASISGAVELSGPYSLQTTPKVSDLLKKAQLTPEAKKDIAFLIRKRQDGTNKLIQLNLIDILANPNGPQNLSLQAEDQLIVNSEEEIANTFSIKVRGAVKNNIEFPIGKDTTINVQQAVFLAGGLMPEAADYGYIFRVNPYNKNQREYIRIDIEQAMSNPQSAANQQLDPMDELIILANSNSSDSLMVGIQGAVRYPADFIYDQSLSIQDLINLSGGLLPNADRQKIDIFRQDFNTGGIAKTIALSIAVDEENNPIGATNDFQLQPFDEVMVRSVANYEPTAIIKIKGEVKYPGEYALLKENETLRDLVSRAGGYTNEAFPEGITISRDKSNSRTLTKNLYQEGKNILLAGDSITVPKKMNWIRIQPENTGVESNKEIVAQEILQVPFHKGKNAKWYIENYAAGFAPTADREKVIVQFPNGAYAVSKKRFVFHKYPTPTLGSTLIVPAEPKATITPEENAPKIYAKKGTIISIDSALSEERKGIGNK